MRKSIAKGPTAGPYSPGIIATGQKFVFVSGQIGQDLKGDIKSQTHESLAKIQKVLSEAGAKMKDIVKTTVYLENIGDYTEMNDVYKTYFIDVEPPARAAFQVAALPLGAKIEIEAIAILDE
ncbi:MAG: RidA family protein [Candidatus Heimdallarchaeota archaeon]